MFDVIPTVVSSAVENNDLLIYSCCIKMSNRGPTLHLGAMFPHGKNKWEPLSAEESKELVEDIKKELRKLRYRATVAPFTHPETGERDFNDFRIRVILKEDRDLTKEHIDKIAKATRSARRGQRQDAQRGKLASQL